jgi:hypothetical protein
MTHSRLHNRKNDFCFAMLMTTILAVSLATGITGYRDSGRDRAAKDSAQAQDLTLALNSAGAAASEKEQAGASTDGQRPTASGSSGPLAR